MEERDFTVEAGQFNGLENSPLEAAINNDEDLTDLVDIGNEFDEAILQMQSMPLNGHPTMPDLPREEVTEIDQNITNIQDLQNKT